MRSTIKPPFERSRRERRMPKAGEYFIAGNRFCLARQLEPPQLLDFSGSVGRCIKAMVLLIPGPNESEFATAGNFEWVPCPDEPLVIIDAFLFATLLFFENKRKGLTDGLPFEVDAAALEFGTRDQGGEAPGPYDKEALRLVPPMAQGCKAP